VISVGVYVSDYDICWFPAISGEGSRFEDFRMNPGQFCDDRHYQQVTTGAVAPGPARERPEVFVDSRIEWEKVGYSWTNSGVGDRGNFPRSWRCLPFRKVSTSIRRAVESVNTLNLDQKYDMRTVFLTSGDLDMLVVNDRILNPIPVAPKPELRKLKEGIDNGRNTVNFWALSADPIDVLKTKHVCRYLYGDTWEKDCFREAEVDPAWHMEDLASRSTRRWRWQNFSAGDFVAKPIDLEGGGGGSPSDSDNVNEEAHQIIDLEGEAAKKVQAITRGWQARKQCAKMREKRDAAVRIQAFHRRMQARKEFNRRVREIQRRRGLAAVAASLFVAALVCWPYIVGNVV
jgi:hypothetical protein